MDSSRRNFIKKATATGTAILAAPAVFGAVSSDTARKKAADAITPFKLKYAPGFGMFRQNAGQDPIDNIKFCKDQGFRAMFDNGLPGREPALQEKIAAEISRQGMELGPYVLRGDPRIPDFVLNKQEIRDMLAEVMKKSIEVTKRTGVKQALIVLGRYDDKLHIDYQTANAIDNLRFCCDIVEPEGITLVLEPLNNLINHPGLFLTRIPQAYAIARAVNRPSCKVLDDLYHQQISEGNLIPNIEAAYSEIAVFHLGDSPGRNEPTTGEINYKNIFKYLYNKGYNGTLCMEHGVSKSGTKEGELRVIEAYRECDSFEV
jgi:hydroxypyruvate isomerase